MVSQEMKDAITEILLNPEAVARRLVEHDKEIELKDEEIRKLREALMKARQDGQFYDDTRELIDAALEVKP